MLFKKIISIIFTAVLFHIGTAGAVGTLIVAASRTDMVHDAKRGVVYIANGSSILRYNIATSTFLSPITITDAELRGIDLSTDGATLAVADHTNSDTDVWVYLINLNTLTASKSSVTKATGENGTHAVAFASNGNLLVTSSYAGSGTVPFRRLDVNTGQWTQVAPTIGQDTMVSASTDRKIIAFAESNSSDGPWGKYDVLADMFVERSGYIDGTSGFNYEISTNADGSQFAVPTYDGTYIYNSAYVRTGIIGTYASFQPIGIAYHPVDNRIYVPFSLTREVRVYDTGSLAKVASYDFQDDFVGNGNFAFGQGRTKLSRDGSLLMVSVTGGVRIYQMYAPLTAAAQTAYATPATPVTIGLRGAIGNGGAINYAISQQPANGNVTVSNGYATYTSTSGFSGTDTFKYMAMYGAATAEATVTVTVNSSIRPAAGWWWNPAEGGRGFTIEQQGTKIFMAGYMYDQFGAATWYAAGPATVTGSTFAAPLISYYGGQTLTGSYKATTGTINHGNISLTFSDTSHATMTLPGGGTTALQRYDIVTGGSSTPPPGGTPESGWWWNSAEGGRGFSIEIQNGTMFMSGYMYDNTGNPVWYASGPTAMTNATTYQGIWQQYGGGQTITGSYKSPVMVNANVGTITVTFSGIANATLTLPNGKQIALTRFVY